MTSPVSPRDRSRTWRDLPPAPPYGAADQAAPSYGAAPGPAVPEPPHRSGTRRAALLGVVAVVVAAIGAAALFLLADDDRGEDAVDLVGSVATTVPGGALDEEPGDGSSGLDELEPGDGTTDDAPSTGSGPGEDGGSGLEELLPPELRDLLPPELLDELEGLEDLLPEDLEGLDDLLPDLDGLEDLLPEELEGLEDLLPGLGELFPDDPGETDEFSAAPDEFLDDPPDQDPGGLSDPFDRSDPLDGVLIDLVGLDDWRVTRNVLRAGGGSDGVEVAQVIELVGPAGRVEVVARTGDVLPDGETHDLGGRTVVVTSVDRYPSVAFADREVTVEITGLTVTDIDDLAAVVTAVEIQ